MKCLTAFTVALVLPLSQAFFFSWGGSGRQEAEADVSQQCIAKAHAGDCHFYTCFDRRHPCTKHNWALSYGWRYCTRYDQERSRFTSEGQTWINSSRRCVMTSLLEFYEDDYINCNDVEHAMKDNHAKCERDNGVCNADMVIENREPLLDIYTLSRHGLVRFLMYIRECGGRELDDFIEWAKERRSSATSLYEAAMDILDDIKSRNWNYDELSIDWPELPDLPSMPELPEIPSWSEIDWPDIGLSWLDDSAEHIAPEPAESSESAEADKVVAAAADEIH